MDNSTFHWSKQTRAYLKTLGLPVIYSAPNSPEINAIEYTIGNIKAVIKKLRDTNK
jgi:transposase